MYAKSKFLKLVGAKFNEWTILSYEGSSRIRVQCSCGRKRIRCAKDIIGGKSKRCSRCKGFKAQNNLKNWMNKPGPVNPNWKGTANIPREYYSQCKTGAQVRGITFNLSIDEMQLVWERQEGKCAYTGMNLVFGRKSKNQDNLSSLDRINSDKEYSVDNVQWVCKTVNLMKQSLSHEQFLDWIKIIANFNRNLLK